MILGLPARSSSERDKERVRWPSKAADEVLLVKAESHCVHKSIASEVNA